MPNNYNQTSQILMQNNNNIQYINQINDLKNKLNNEKERYKQLEQKYNQLYANNQANINNINQLKSELIKYKNQLTNNNLNNNINLNNEINNLRQQNNILFNQINIKDNEINNLRLKLENNYISQPKISKKDIMVINFVTGDSKIMNCGIGCLPDETFAEVEEKLYKIYDEYRNTDNYFLYHGTKILRFKKIMENKIENGAVIQLVQN